MLLCVFPVCYDVRLSHLNKYYLLTYLHAGTRTAGHQTTAKAALMHSAAW